jgi:hypothetical protein
MKGRDDMKPSDWDSYTEVTEDLAVGRWGKLWRVIDKQTGSEIGPPFHTKWEAREYADHRQATTYGRPRP